MALHRSQEETAEDAAAMLAILVAEAAALHRFKVVRTQVRTQDIPTGKSHVDLRLLIMEKA